MARMCPSTAWIPPGPMSPIRCRRDPFTSAWPQAARSASLSKNEPSATAALIRGRSWRTGMPAPRLRWPTSLLPICPGGRPTASPAASRRADGQRAERSRQCGIFAAMSAFRCGSSFRPNPSRTQRTTGLGGVRGTSVIWARRPRRGRSRRTPLGRARRRPPARRRRPAARNTRRRSWRSHCRRTGSGSRRPPWRRARRGCRE